MNIAVLIPSLNPNETLPQLIQQLQQRGILQIAVIDDGSTPVTQPIFDRCSGLGCLMIHHHTNQGKGAAIRTGLRALQEQFPSLSGIVTADGDGQHLPDDIFRVAQELELHPDSLILGTRDFSQPGIPRRSRFGNRFSSLFFRLSTGISCPDTQTGLRGLPCTQLNFFLSVPGDRYDYEMNALCQSAQQKLPIRYVPIQTIYENGNSTSHFHPITDSMRIYAAPLRFAAASLASCAVDLALFALFAYLLHADSSMRIVAATVGARLISGVFNFILNRHWSFSSTGEHWSTQGIRYLILFLCQMFASGGLTALLSILPLPLVLIKLVVDTVLFCLSYFIQQAWVFRQPSRS